MNFSAFLQRLPAARVQSKTKEWIATLLKCCPSIRGTTSSCYKRRDIGFAFVGDGINDSIALKKADVSISLRGASTIATDTAQVVFTHESLEKLCAFVDISRSLERNVQRGWQMILIPNGFCIAGIFISDLTFGTR
jgi:P-type E1-E2 ATPase